MSCGLGEGSHYACDCFQAKLERYERALKAIADPKSDTHHVCCANWPESKGYPCNCDSCTARAALEPPKPSKTHLCPGCHYAKPVDQECARCG